MKINAKMLVYILSTSILIFVGSVGYITTRARQLAIEEAQKNTINKAHEYVNLIKSELISDFNIAKALAQSAQAYQSFSWEEWSKVFLEQQLQILSENPHYIAVATSWELQYIDPNWEKSYGRYLNGWVRDKDGNINQVELKLNTEGDDFRSDYYKIKSTRESTIANPEAWSPTGNKEDQYANTNFSVPIVLGNTFVGLAGIDIDLYRFQEIIKKINPFENSQAYLLANNGAYITHPNPNMISKLISDVAPEFNEKYQIIEKIQEGISFSFTSTNENNQKDYYVFAPLKINNIDTPWSLAIVVPNKIITSNANRILYNAFFAVLIGLLLLSIIIWFISKNITDPVINVTKVLKNLAKGNISESTLIKVKSKDELGEMALALKTSINGLNKKTRFANQIGSGNIDFELELLSEDDQLGQSLIQMRNSLLKAKSEEEKRKLDEEKRRWINEGLAKFAEILRKDNDDLNALAKEIIKNLVYYLEVNQGGILILNEHEESVKIYDLLAAFAYDREKFVQKRIELGEGLVGTCAKERNIIYLTEIPQDYINVTSGLGEAKPNSLLLVPLIMENEVLGVVELASFKKFKKHEIEFAEKVADSIGATLKSVRINTKTSFLLEQSQQQAEEMSAQEEEMRQNMEELQATQEEADNKSYEHEGLLDTMNRFLIKLEFDLNFTLTDANERFLKKFKFKKKEILGMEAEEFIADRDIAKFHEIFNTVMNGESHREITYLKGKGGKEFEILSSFSPVFVNERLKKILLLGVDVNDK